MARLSCAGRTCILDSSPWVGELMNLVRKVVDAGTPILGVCYGHQIIARSYGGDPVVRISPTPEIGWVEVVQDAPNPLLEGLPKKFYSFQSHFEEVQKAPSGFVVTASTPRCPIQAYYIQGKPVFGVQFHPERNAAEGQQSIDSKKTARPPVARDCIFGDGKAESIFSEYVAKTIFSNFLRQRGHRK
ncbi:MAG: gamma-glutamyl-gamma-aminobutyrate hydrolase family protein [Deltaproteobacteria bacterium]|nr:gamma-glutamyl-gamma-aminobutyrate hydrolase family protein [Deltaproteobacteria bacterium]